MSCLGLLLAAALLWILQGILYKHFWKKGLSASVSFCQTDAVEGECAALTETVTNAKYLPLTALHVKFQMGRDLVFLNRENSSVTDYNYRSDIFSCMPWQQIRRRLEFQCKKRGFYTIRQIDLSGYDLLWSSRFYLSLPADTSMYVYPAFIDPVQLSIPLRQLTGTLAARQALLQDPFELRSIRDYTQGDSLRDINWKATARTGDLRVNVHAPAASWQVMLLLDGSSARLLDDSKLREESIRLCATLADQLLSRHIPVALCTNGRDCETRQELFLPAGANNHHLSAVLKLLARADFSDPKLRSMDALIESRFLSGAATEASDYSDTTLYVLISPCQRKLLSAAWQRLCAISPGSQWILPLHPGEPVCLHTDDDCPLQQLYPWEVPYER